jgi:gliding motility-associated-like protein
MNKCIVFIFFFFVTKTASSQLPELQWAKAFVANNQSNYSVYSNGRSVAVDRQGNVYSAGLFNHTMDCDPGPAVFDLTAAGPFETSIYITKLSPAGNFLWAIQVPTSISFGSIEINVDKLDNVYLAAYISTPTDFDPGPGNYILTPIGGNDAFVVKYDPNGNLVWAKQFGGPGDTVPRSNVLDIDNNNNIIVCGQFNNTVDFDPGPNTFNLTSSAHIQSFIVKLNNSGDFIWAKQFGNSPVVYSGSSIGDVKCDQQGNIYTVGNFQGLCDFDPGTANYPLQSLTFSDGFIAKIDGDGKFIWAKRIGLQTANNSGYCQSRGIDVDSDNNVYTTGNFIGTHDFDPGPNTHIISSNTYDDWYLLKLNEQGDFEWVDIFGGYDQDIGADVVVGIDGNVYAVGPIGHITDMDPGPGIHNITSVNQYGTSALVKVNSNGEFIYAVSFESINDVYGSCLTRRMAIDNALNIYITGSFGGTVDFDPGPDVYSIYSGSYGAPMTMKLSRCKNITTANLNISACDSYTLNNEIFDSTGVYTQVIPNSSGCDSIITLTLTINKKFTQQTKTICEGEMFFAGGINQISSGTYIDTLQTVTGCDSIVTTYLSVKPRPSANLGPDKDICTNTQLTLTPGSFANYLWQDGSNANSFTVTTPGTYWVRVTNNFDCTATDTFIVHTLLPLPANFLKEKDSICSYGNLEIASANAYTNYQWSNGTAGKKMNIQQPGKYWLTVTDANGCSGTDSIVVFPKPCMLGVYIPTAFTPNNDGRNDVFKSLVFGKIVSFKLQVFDRAGQLIFQTTDPDKDWNGCYKGIPYTTSTFVWQCFYQLEGQQPAYQKGTVTIIL